MSSTNTRSTNWRQRMADKERREKEALAYLAELERAKHAVLNEFNFPSHLVAAAWPVSAQISGFADRAAEADRKDQIEQQVREYRKQRAALESQTNQKFASGVVTFRGLGFRPHRQVQEEEDENWHDDVEEVVDLTELYPPHRGRRYCTEPDSEGWRRVIRYTRTKRELTNAELEHLARTEILGQEEDADLNGDLNDRNQRREFY